MFVSRKPPLPVRKYAMCTGRYSAATIMMDGRMTSSGRTVDASRTRSKFAATPIAEKRSSW